MKHQAHIGVYAIIIENEKILLVQKSRGPYKGKFDLPGGRLEHGETTEEALSREVKEETGINEIKDIRLFNNYTYHAIYEDEGPVSFYHIGLVYSVTHFSEPTNYNVDFEDVAFASWLAIPTLNYNHLSPFASLALKELHPF